ncbi:CS1 type fimbrial major subunit [Pseudomonas sp. BIC9C]|uniref:CS1 type fimbrial major subunit n=1 Tax=Pseudomonas sp. BIC9C TaxID=3078458 RepID=UPI002AD30E43|nr:CS1 type fimbrial major subunit [Pseudomonas sp. BIC9C]
MLKKIAIATPMAVLALSSSMVFAADPISTTINVRAFIPTSQFNVAPQNPNFGRDEVMTQLVGGELSTVDAIFNLKHTDSKGAINALIEGSAVLYNGRDSIPLTVTIGSVELAATTKEIVNETDSVPGVQRALRIKAKKPTASQTGDFTSSFAVVFEPVLKP